MVAPLDSPAEIEAHLDAVVPDQRVVLHDAAHSRRLPAHCFIPDPSPVRSGGIYATQPTAVTNTDMEDLVAPYSKSIPPILTSLHAAPERPESVTMVGGSSTTDWDSLSGCGDSHSPGTGTEGSRETVDGMTESEGLTSPAFAVTEPR